MRDAQPTPRGAPSAHPRHAPTCADAARTRAPASPPPDTGDTPRRAARARAHCRHVDRRRARAASTGRTPPGRSRCRSERAAPHSTTRERAARCRACPPQPAPSRSPSATRPALADALSVRASAHPASIATPTEEKKSVRSASSCPVGTRMFEAARYASTTQPSATSGRRSPRFAIAIAAAAIEATTRIATTALGIHRTMRNHRRRPVVHRESRRQHQQVRHEWPRTRHRPPSLRECCAIEPHRQRRRWRRESAEHRARARRSSAPELPRTPPTRANRARSPPSHRSPRHRARASPTGKVATIAGTVAADSFAPSATAKSAALARWPPSTMTSPCAGVEGSHHHQHAREARERRHDLGRTRDVRDRLDVQRMRREDHRAE